MSGRPVAQGLGLPALVITAGARWCALPLEHVVETMRPLPIEPLAGMPPAVLGLAVIRGVPTPVVDLGALLGAASGSPTGRFVTLSLSDRRVALGVGSVEGLTVLDAARLSALPPLLNGGSEAAFALGLRDEQLLFVLQTVRLLPEQVWTALALALAETRS